MKIKAIAGLMLLVAVFACASEKRTPARAPIAAAPPAATSPQADPPQTQSDIRIADDIRRACGISDADAHFAFDSSLVRDVDYPVLRKLVACFGSGPLAKREMRLVGHADPRGDDEYNLLLGGSRADGVKRFLIQGGLSQAQVATSSRGEMDSKGVDEASWSNDRRVDVLLAN
jgi:peptidoglycan-associated lipoprotein